MKIIQFLFLSLLLNSCANDMAVPESIKNPFAKEIPMNAEINDIKIIYVLPQKIINFNDFDCLNFKNDHWGRDTAQNKVIVKYNDKMMQIERRTDNGVAGSGRIYNVEITKTHNTKNNEVLFTLQPKSMQTYQDGVILPFPIPEFDIQSYLASAKINYKFELNSEFPAESIKANFDRALGASKIGEYRFQLDNTSASVTIAIKMYPYRTGSKASIDCIISNMKPINDTIDVSKIISEIENHLKAVVNS